MKGGDGCESVCGDGVPGGGPDARDAGFPGREALPESNVGLEKSRGLIFLVQPSQKGVEGLQVGV